MDIISYGIASKAAKQEQYTRNDVLGIGVEGSYPHVKARIDNLEKAIQGVVAQADKLIVNDAINIMKAHAKLNAVAKSMKYKMHNMIFDDLLDLSGIDTTKSSGYVHDATNGLVKASGSENYIIVTKVENIDAVPEKAILIVEESKKDELIPRMNVYENEIGKIYGTNDSAIYGYHLYKAFDGSPGTYWRTNYNSSNVIGFEFKKPTVVNMYSIQSRPSCSPYKWQFRGYSIETGWVVLDSHDLEPNYADVETRFYQFDNNYPYTKYELYIDRQYNTGSAPWIYEIQFYDTRVSSVYGKYYLSRDGGVTFEPITPETLFYFTAKSPVDTKLVLKAELPANIQLLNYALTWA